MIGPFLGKWQVPDRLYSVTIRQRMYRTFQLLEQTARISQAGPAVRTARISGQWSIARSGPLQVCLAAYRVWAMKSTAQYSRQRNQAGSSW
jgi:hypothetical protein